MSKLTKNKKLALAKIEDGKVYSIDEAAQLVKEITFTKFDASVDMRTAAVRYASFFVLKNSADLQLPAAAYL